MVRVSRSLVRVLPSLAIIVFLAACKGGSAGIPGPPGPGQPGGAPIWPPNHSFTGLPRTLEWTAGVEGRTTTLPAVRGGTPPIRYALAGDCLPDGLHFVESARTIQGTAANPADASLCIYTATDANERSPAPINFFVKVRPPSTPLLAWTSGSEANDLSGATLAWGVGEVVNRRLPRADSASDPVAYSLKDEDCLPEGLQFLRTIPAIRGTPSRAAPASLCEYTARDADGRTLTIEFRVQVLAVPVRAFTWSSTTIQGTRLRFTAGEHGTETLPAARGGKAPIEYSLNAGCLPAGLSLLTEQASPAIGGSAQESKPQDLCTYQAEDADGRTLMLQFFVEVLPSTTPTSQTLAWSTHELVRSPRKSLSFTTGERVTYSMPAATGGTPPYTYALRGEGCESQAGLRLVGSDLIGVAKFIDTPLSCEYRATDSASPPATISLGFLLSVEPVGPDAFRFENVHIADRDYAVGDTVCIRLPRAVRGGSDMLDVEYSISTPLPPGLTLHRPEVAADPACEPNHYPRIAGRPTDSSLLTRYCLIAAADGEESIRTCFYMRTVNHRVARFTVITGTEQDVFLTYDPAGAPVTNPLRVTLSPATIPEEWRREARYTLTPQLTPAPGTCAAHDPTVAGQLLWGQGNPATRVFPFLCWMRSGPGLAPTLTTYTYGVRRGGTEGIPGVAVCLDVRLTRGEQYDEGPPEILSDTITISYRNEAVRTMTGEFVCNPAPTGDDRPENGNQPGPQTDGSPASNPVHEALGPVHARRAARFVHGVVAERVRSGEDAGAGATPFTGAEVAALSGAADGFTYSGESESLHAGLDVLTPGEWRLGVVGAFTRTELDYAAPLRLRPRYVRGEHETELSSVHPFAARDFGRSVLWASLGYGTGTLRFRDLDPGSPYHRVKRTGLGFSTFAAGGAYALRELLGGELSAEAGYEQARLEIEGAAADAAGSGIAAMTLDTRDLTAGLAWDRQGEALRTHQRWSFGYRRAFGDGEHAHELEAGASLRLDDLAPGLDVRGSLGGSWALGGKGTRSWRLGGALAYAPGEPDRGVSLGFEPWYTGDDRYGAALEAGYGLHSASLGETLFPYYRLSHRPSSAEHALGVRGAGRSPTTWDLRGFSRRFDSYDRLGAEMQVKLRW